MIEQLYLLFFYPAPYLVIIGEINYNKMIEKVWDSKYPCRQQKGEVGLSHKWCNKVVLVGIFIVLSITSCNTSNSRKGEIKQEKKPVTFVFYNADGKEDPWTDPVAKKITEKTGVTLKTDYPVEGNDKKIALMIATGEYPDLIFAKGDAGELIENKSLIDLSNLIDKYGPNIKKLYGDDYEKLRYSEDDPSIYQLCCSRVQNKILSTSGTAQLQWGVIMANDYKVPKTLDEYEMMIKDYMQVNPTITGKKTIGLTICCLDWHWYTTLSNPSGYIANGSKDNGQWIIDSDHNAHYKPSVKGQKKFYRWMNKMYNEGVLDPEFATQTYEDYVEKIASGRVLGILDSDWDYSEAEQVLREDGKYDRTYLGLPITIDDSITCSSLADQGLAIGWGVGITKSCKDPVRAVKFINWLCSEEGQILLNWGIEGENYYYDDDGKRCRTREEIQRTKTDTNYIEDTGIGFHNYPFPSYGSEAVDSTGNYYMPENKESVKVSYNKVEKQALKNWNMEMLTDIFPQPDKFEKPSYAPLWSQTFSVQLQRLQDKLDEITWKRLIQCIACKPDEFEKQWKALQEELDNAGREQAEKEVTEIIQKQAAFWKNS